MKLGPENRALRTAKNFLTVLGVGAVAAGCSPQARAAFEYAIESVGSNQAFATLDQYNTLREFVDQCTTGEPTIPDFYSIRQVIESGYLPYDYVPLFQNIISESETAMVNGRMITYPLNHTLNTPVTYSFCDPDNNQPIPLVAFPDSDETISVSDIGSTTHELIHAYLFRTTVLENDGICEINNTHNVGDYSSEELQVIYLDNLFQAAAVRYGLPVEDKNELAVYGIVTTEAVYQVLEPMGISYESPLFSAVFKYLTTRFYFQGDMDSRLPITQEISDVYSDAQTGWEAIYPTLTSEEYAAIDEMYKLGIAAPGFFDFEMSQ